MAKSQLSLGKRLAFSLVLAVLLLGALELGGRVLDELRIPLLTLIGRDPRQMDLAPYQVKDPRFPGHWTNRPGYQATLVETVQNKRSLRRFVGLDSIEATAAQHGIPPDEVVMRINSQGFKGPELDASRTRPRIVALGDSCTAGTQLDWFTYSRSLERELARLGVPVEVVNAGVEGYEPADILLRIEDFTALEPDWTILYAGWNALWDGKEAQSFLERHSKAWKVVRFLGRVLDPKPSQTRREAALDAFTKPKRPILDAPEVRAREDYVPTFFGDMLAIIDVMEATEGRVALVTLPGLYTTRQEPTPEALVTGHLPQYTDNPYEIARMTERYNELLRQVARERDLFLIDLERWAEQALVPRHAWFTDSVHLTEAGQAKIGEFMAEALAPQIQAQKAAAAARDR